MAEAGNPAQQEDGARPENPILAFFSNLIASIKLPFPPNDGAKNNAKVEPGGGSSQAESVQFKPVAATEDETKNGSDVVTFPRQSFPQLKLEAEAEDAERNTNPLILWQVYAIGGFFILKWAWSRWNERKGHKKSDDEPPPAED